MITGHFVDAYHPVVDGVVRVTQGYREHMERELGPSWVVTPSHPGAPKRESRVLRYASLPFSAPYRMGLSIDPRVRAKIVQIPWDIVHAHSPFSAGELARFAAERRRAPLVFSLHTRYAEWARVKYHTSPRWAAVMGLDAWLQPASKDRLRPWDLLRVTRDGEAYVTRAVQRKVWRYAAACQCVVVSTPSARDELLSFADVVGDAGRPRIEVIRCGIRSFEPSANGIDVRARHALPNGVPLLLYVGQLVEEKGLGFLLEAVAHRRARSVPFRLLIVGEGSRRTHYEKLAARLGIAERCVFTGVIADPDELAAYFRAASLFVFPSLFETQGLVVMEAASVGLCTLGLCGAPGVRDLITDGVNGFLAEATVTDYATRLAQLLGDRGLRRVVGERARSLVRTREAAAADIVELYRELCSEKSSSFGPPSGLQLQRHAAQAASRRFQQQIG